MHVQTLDAPGQRRANFVGVARLDGADAEQGWRNGFGLDRGHGDRDGCQGAGSQAHIDEHREQWNDHGQQREGAALQREFFHCELPMPRR